MSRDVLVGLLGGFAEWMLSDDPRNWLAWREWQHHKASGLFDQAANAVDALNRMLGPNELEGA